MAQPAGKIHGNTSRDHIHRIYMILAELQNGRFPTRDQLAQLCDVSAKTIDRDFRSMELLMEVEISYDQGATRSREMFSTSQCSSWKDAIS